MLTKAVPMQLNGTRSGLLSVTLYQNCKIKHARQTCRTWRWIKTIPGSKMTTQPSELTSSKNDPAHNTGRRARKQLAMIWFEDDEVPYHKDQW